MSQLLEPVECPDCCNQTYVLKEHRFWHLTVVFLVFVVHYRYRSEWMLACPSCMRRALWRWNLKSLVTANLLWPVFILPVYASRTIGTFLPWSNYEGRPWWKRSLGYFALCACAAAAAMVIISVIGYFNGAPITRSDWLLTAVISLAAFPFFATVAALLDA